MIFFFFFFVFFFFFFFFFFECSLLYTFLEYYISYCVYFFPPELIEFIYRLIHYYLIELPLSFINELFNLEVYTSSFVISKYEFFFTWFFYTFNVSVEWWLFYLMQGDFKGIFIELNSFLDGYIFGEGVSPSIKNYCEKTFVLEKRYLKVMDTRFGHHAIRPVSFYNKLFHAAVPLFEEAWENAIWRALPFRTCPKYVFYSLKQFDDLAHQKYLDLGRNMVDISVEQAKEGEDTEVKHKHYFKDERKKIAVRHEFLTKRSELGWYLGYFPQKGFVDTCLVCKKTILKRDIQILRPRHIYFAINRLCHPTFNVRWYFFTVFPLKKSSYEYCNNNLYYFHNVFIAAGWLDQDIFFLDREKLDTLSRHWRGYVPGDFFADRKQARQEAFARHHYLVEQRKQMVLIQTELREELSKYISKDKIFRQILETRYKKHTGEALPHYTIEELLDNDKKEEFTNTLDNSFVDNKNES